MKKDHKKRSPTAPNVWGHKVHCSDGYTFDSDKEHDFYHRFVKHCGYKFAVHPNFKLQELTAISNVDKVNINAISYTPDFVIYDDQGNFKHVYDVKNSLGKYGIDASVKLRFRLFAAKYKFPVEAVAIRTHDFKVIAQGVTKPLNEKQPLIKKDFNYDWLEATNY